MENYNDSSSEIKCGAVKGRNLTNQFDRGWEGLPTNLFLNSFIFILMILLFICLRKKAWNRKSSQLTRTHKGWLHFIYGNRDNRKEPSRPLILHDHHVHNNSRNSKLLLPPSFEEEERDEEILSPTNGIRVNDRDTRLSIQTRKKSLVENGDQFESNEEDATEERIPKRLFERSISTTEFGYWLCDILCIKEKDILNRKGSDAVQYLIFQRYIIYYLILLTFICMFIVLPVNLMGNAESNKPFARTTISNILNNVDLIWCHVVLSMVLLPIGFYLMCHFSKTIKADEPRIVKRTLCVQRIPKSKRNKESLYDCFNKLFPDVVIEGIQFVYNTHQLKALDLEYNSVVNAKYYCQEYFNEYHKRSEFKPYFLKNFGASLMCCKCDKVDGLTYYENKELELERSIEKEFRGCISNPSGSAFITLQNEKMAQKVYRALKKNQEQSCNLFPCNCCFRLRTWLEKICNDVKEDEFEIHRWLVSYAPYPDDINWDDISVDYKLIWFRRIVVHLCLFVLFFFLSTPSIVINILNSFKVESTLRIGLEYMLFQQRQFATEYLSPLLLVIASIILPSFVILACQYLPYKTLSDLNHSFMWKTFVFLVMMVIILPSLDMSSAHALVSSLAYPGDNKSKWECLFPVDNGAFFVNYVLQSALLGNAMELLRFPELFLYFFYYTFYAKTPAEYEKARQHVIFDFKFGIRYPRFLLIFCMVVTYSLSCPLIAPCGLLYMILKHIVDRYNIYYVYTPSKINGRIHSTAITFFHVGMLMMVFQIFTFAFIKTGPSDVSKILMFVVIIATIVFSGHCFFHCFWNINHLTYSSTNAHSSARSIPKEFCACSYLPPVLFDLNINGIVPPEYDTSKNYGSLTPSPSDGPIQSPESSTRLTVATLNA